MLLAIHISLLLIATPAQTTYRCRIENLGDGDIYFNAGSGAQTYGYDIFLGVAGTMPNSYADYELEWRHYSLLRHELKHVQQSMELGGVEVCGTAQRQAPLHIHTCKIER